eukprot:gene8201-16867_t
MASSASVIVCGGVRGDGFGPSVKSVENIDVEKVVSVQEMPVQSAITIPQDSSKLSSGINTIQ